MVQRHVFDQLPDGPLHAFVVWGPMQGDEERADAVGSTRFLDDPRTTHLWTPGHDLAELLAPVAGLPAEERAWDIFLLYAPGVAWGEEPPDPDLVQHVNKPLPDDQRLHGPTLLARVKELLDGTSAKAAEEPAD